METFTTKVVTFSEETTPLFSLDTEEDVLFWSVSSFNLSNLSADSLEVFWDDGSNITDSGFDRKSSWDDLWKGIPLGLVLAFLCLLTTTGNVMVLYAVRTEKRLQTVSNLYIVSLAVADMIVGIIVMPMSTFYIFSGHWTLGVAVCQIWIGVDYTASTASILNLFILSLDRYWSVRQPLKYLHKRTKRRALSMIGVVWAISALWVIPIGSWHYIAHGGKRTVPDIVCDTEYAKNMPFKLITAFFNFYLPISIMYILYFKVFNEIRKRSQFEMGQRNPGGTMLAYKAAGASNHSEEFSDGTDVGIGATDCLRIGSSTRSKENGSRSTQSGCRNVKLVAVKRIQSQNLQASMRESTTVPYKVEYVYDENVIDPKTEKIERYFYEDHYPVPILSPWSPENDRVSEARGSSRNSRQLTTFKIGSKYQHSSSYANNGNNCSREQHLHFAFPPKKNSCSKKRFFKKRKGNLHIPTNSRNASGCSRPESYKTRSRQETSFTPNLFPDSAEASSSSSASTFEERRRCDDNTSDKEKMRRQRVAYSVMGGIQNIRKAEPFIDRTSGGGLVPNGAAPASSSSRVQEDPDSALGLPENNHSHKRGIGGTTVFKANLKAKRQSSSLKKEIKAARQLGVIMGAFTLCFLPYFVLFMVVSFCDDCVNPGLLTAATWIGYLNSTLNPFLYPLCNVNFRMKFRSMLKCCSRRSDSFRNSRDSRQGYLDRTHAVNSRYD